ncbi:MAG: M1 family metallopeptidase [Anaerolineales bacterium]|nr:M1 family metallopeptidase [Anaerolineales bacterium]
MNKKIRIPITLFLLSLILTSISCKFPFSPNRQVATEPPAEEYEKQTDEDQPDVADAPPTPPDEESPVEMGNPDNVLDPYAPELGTVGIDVLHYTIRNKIDPTELYSLSGSVSIKAKTLLPIDEIWLDFVGFDVQEITLDSKEVPFAREGGKLVISSPEVINAGEAFDLEIAYDGEADLKTSRYVDFEDHVGLFYPDGESMFVLSEPDGARFWYPCNDHPQDKAEFRFEFEVPAGYTAVSNGEMIQHNTLENGDEYFVWEHNSPMATYLATVAVDKFELIEGTSPNGVHLRSYATTDTAALMRSKTKYIGEAIDWMSEHFGEYPFDQFGYVIVRAEGVSLETQTIVLLDDDMIDDCVLVHEMSHMWFGDWVSLDSWGEIWRNEGFATFFHLYYDNRNNEDIFGEDISHYESMMYGEETNTQPLNDISPENMFGWEAYFKGAVAVYHLRELVGEDAFYKGLQTYFERYGGSVASDEEFFTVMEEISGMSLQDYYNEWIAE